MNPIRQKLRIREICIQRDLLRRNVTPESENYFIKLNTLFGIYTSMDFPNDLNAMAVAEQQLDCCQNPGNMTWFHKYEQHLNEVTQGNAVFATAQDRAEAFLRTFGQWES